MPSTYSAIKLKYISFAIAAILGGESGAVLAQTGDGATQNRETIVNDETHPEETERQTAGTETRVLETITVSAQRREIVSGGTLGARSDLQTPFATHSVDSEKIEERQAKTIGKLFEGEAGVAAKGSSYGLDAYALTVRGLSLDFVNGYKIDGHPFQMYGVELPLEMFEQVQLLKGATGFLYGIGSPGGIVNYISKKPTTTQTLSLAAGYSADDIFSQHLDTGGRFGEDDRFGYRFNAVNEQGEAYNGTKVDRQAASLFLDARLTPSLTWRANGLYQERDLEGGITAISVTGSGNYAYSGTTLPAAIGGRKNLTAYDSSYYNSTVWVGASGLAWSINDSWTLDASYSHTFKRINSRDETLYLRNAQGDYNVALRQFYRPTLNYDSVQLRLEGDFETGWLTHSIVTGLEWQQQTRDLNIGNPSLDPSTSSGGQNHVYPSSGAYPSGNLYGSSLNLTYDGYSPRRYFRISDWTTKSAYFSDTLGLGENWSLLLGLRKFDYENNNYYVSGARRTAYREKPLTPTMALMFTPRPDTTFYASYVEALEDGGTVGSAYANAYQQLSPIESKQYELGVKSERENWSLASALFRIERGTGYANADNYYVDDGAVRYDGLEFNGSYRPLSGLTFSLGSTWMHAEYREAAASVIGKKAAAVPTFQGSLSVEKEIAALPGLRVHGGVTHIGRQYINTANTLQTPSYEVYSIGASYRVPLAKGKLIYRAELNNLLNKDYWIASSNALAVGAPRTLNLNIRYDF
ncbi:MULTISPECIES: TonB-dependent siderophore receptor [Brenneria]|uniref:TonB-dependent siderophore receptor n=1 Tax=Brenneria nigrifluens DSM 30175 = ATCC 13028 TaxID=1121120 RepID=A0A2U1UTM4_9GAMM|nr:MULTISPECIES: TonB-dependent siderophore receptor [Brenneria]EHD19721.1 TonB-dependent siderophore receptor [Brenneria sp. EniD312]PWC25014.1 TonB-dependent siderophore receptor [Brenneria nigrifluens DSM 30175 = ATCC 13028]QCR02983.1 TonB-dependent siderophore receptor [Brenneria nigrifluens DSM 30175 = ATCC 13028]